MDETNTIGARLRHAREEHGLTREGLAERSGISRDLIAKLEQEQRKSARLGSLAALAEALDIDLSDLLGKSDAPLDVLGLHDQLMRRRAFVRCTGAAAAMMMAPGALHTVPSCELIAACSELTALYRRMDALAGPMAVYGHAAEHQRWLAAWLHSTHDPGQWRQVAYLFADATILLAWLHFDLEHYEQAAVLYRQCIELADALGDANMRVFSIGRISRTLSECGQHDEALTFADAAQQAAGETALPELRSWLAITRSYIHACTGKGYACRTDIEAAEILLRTPGEPPPPYLEFYGPAYMRKWAGHALLKLGSRRPGAIAAGRQAVDQALSTWASQDVRESGEVMVACAYARRAQNEIPEAAQLAGRAYRVAVTTASPRIGRYVFELRQHLVRYRNTPAVRELDEAMLGRQPGA